MAAPDLGVSRTVSPVASVWCRQVDNEAESPGYTAIPDEFPGRRETMESIRIVGNLTVNVADTHDYWDPDPTQTLSFYPNLFLFPAAGGRYTCVGRMFLSTEDRPRLGMKTLVFSTQELLGSGDFGGMVLRAQATMDGRSDRRRPQLEPDPAVFQVAGEGFLFHRGATDPVVVVASDQWEAVTQVVQSLIRTMPASLVALGAFLVFPYFLPAAKVNLNEFTEQLPLALAVMRVPRQEAEGDRHAKRMQSWEAQPVTLRDLTRPAGGRAKETIPLVLQYLRDHTEETGIEVSRRVDLVEGPRLGTQLADPDHQGGRDRRREMWRIGTAMETAALLLSRPKGRTVPVSGETAKRANEYLEARPGESPMLASPKDAPEPPAALPPRPAPAPSMPTPAAAPPPSAPAPPARTAAADPLGGAIPEWLRPPPRVAVASNEPTSPPVSTADDPSLYRAPPPPAATPPVSPASAPIPPPPLLRTEPRIGIAPLGLRTEEGPRSIPSAADRGLVDARVALAVRDLERRWSAAVDLRVQQVTDQLRTELTGRLTALENRPSPTSEAIRTEVDAHVKAAVAPEVDRVDQKVAEAVRSTSEGWAERFRREFHTAAEELAARSAKAEEELRTALVAQLDLEVLEAKEQGTSLREEIEARVRAILGETLTEADQRRAKETRDLEQRVGLLVDGRTKDVEHRLTQTITGQTQRISVTADDRISHAERRLSVERDARLAEISEAQRAALAGLQVRMQSFIEEKVRENQTAEQEKYIELLARLKADLEQTLEHSLSSPEFEAAMRERVGQAVEAGRVDQRAAFLQSIADAEERLRKDREEAAARLTDVETKIGARETDLAGLEDSIRAEIDDLDRRVMVVNDHLLPVVRQTWLRVSQHELELRARDFDAHLASLRDEITAEIRRVENELHTRNAELRDRLESSVASHGRIWLNLLRQFSPDEGGLPLPASSPSHRFPRRARARASTLPAESYSTAPPEPDAPPFAADPPNPMDPELGEDPPPKEPRRRTRRT